MQYNSISRSLRRFAVLPFVLAVAVCGATIPTTPEGKAMIDSGATAAQAQARDRAEYQFEQAMADTKKAVGSRDGVSFPGHASVPFGMAWEAATQGSSGGVIQKNCTIGAQSGDCFVQIAVEDGFQTKATHLFISGRAVTTFIELSKNPDNEGGTAIADCYPLATGLLLSIIKSYGTPDDGLPLKKTYLDPDYSHVLPSWKGAAFVARGASFTFIRGATIEFEVIEIPVENRCFTRAFYRSG